MSSVFSQIWLELSGMRPGAVSQQLQQQGYSLRGHRESPKLLFKSLSKYITTAASLGGILIGCISLFADFTNSMISGSAIFIASSTLIFYHETFKAEKFLFYGKGSDRKGAYNVIMFFLTSHFSITSHHQMRV